MRILLVCAALCAASSSNVLASTEFQPIATKFAYGGRHSMLELPATTLSALRPTEDPAVPEMPAAAGDGDKDDSGVDAPNAVATVVTAQKLTRVFSKSELCTTAASVAEANNLPVPFFTNLIQQESGFKPHVVSPAGAQGIAQFMPRIAAHYGLHNPFDPIHALAVSGRFLRELLEQFGNNLGLAAAAYNGGSGRVGNWLARKGKLPDETRTYVRNITGQPVEHWVRAKAKAEEVKLPKHARCPNLQTIEARITVPAQAGYAVASAAEKSAAVASKGGKKTIVIGGSPSKKPIAVAVAQPGKKPAAGVAAARGKVNTTIMAAENPGKGKQASIKLASADPAAISAAISSAAKPAAKPAAKAAAKAEAKTAGKAAAKPAAAPAASKKVKVAAR